MPETKTDTGSEDRAGVLLKIRCPKCKQKLDVSALPPFSRVACPACGELVTVPEIFDRYLLLSLYGIGGTSKVYRACDPALDRIVALKILNRESIRDPDAVDLFLHEARAAANLTDPSVIPVYACGSYQEQPFIAMQFMENGSLDARMKERGRLPVPDVLRYFHSAASGLAHALRAGIIHHDVKPANIMLDREDHAKIGDFGISQIISQPTPAAASDSQWVSPAYVSPEKLQSASEDSRGDIYSLGAAFYHLLTGTPPFAGENLTELLQKRLTEMPPPPAERNPDIPGSVSDLVMRMLRADPEERPGYPEILAVLNAELQKNALPASAGQALPPEMLLAAEHGRWAELARLAEQEAQQHPAGSSAALHFRMTEVFASSLGKLPDAEKRARKLRTDLPDSGPDAPLAGILDLLLEETETETEEMLFRKFFTASAEIRAAALAAFQIRRPSAGQKSTYDELKRQFPEHSWAGLWEKAFPLPVLLKIKPGK